MHTDQGGHPEGPLSSAYDSEITLLPESVALHGGDLQKGGGLCWPLGTEFMMLLQKRILGHIEGRDQENLLVKQSKGKTETQCTTQTWVWTCLITGATSALTSGVFKVKSGWGFGLNLP
jgi:hypothetical protein